MIILISSAGGFCIGALTGILSCELLFRGRWESGGKCSCCGSSGWERSNYCPNCGAKMKHDKH